MSFFACYMGASLDQFLCILFRGPSQISLFDYSMAAPSDHFFVSYKGLSQISYFAYYMGAPQISLIAYYMVALQIRFFVYYRPISRVVIVREVDYRS